jgi:hypothetical protein
LDEGLLSNVTIIPANHPTFTRAFATVKLEWAQGKITAEERDQQLAILEEQRAEGTFGQPANPHYSRVRSRIRQNSGGGKPLPRILANSATRMLHRIAPAPE